MTPEERSLINGLFDRMGSFGTPEKDRDAEALIGQRIRAMPDAPYMLTQSVLVQEQALEAANRRVQELEERVQALEQDMGAPPQRSGSFLGGAPASRWGNQEGRSGSVPQVGARSTPSGYAEPAPWQSVPPRGGPAPEAGGGGGGFMRSAMATAAGVAGGMLVAESIRNMMGGSHAKGSILPEPKDEKHQETQQASASDRDAQHDHDDAHHDQEAYDTASDDSFDDTDFDSDSMDV
jgi:hypothetical protein